jgi:sugar diacid utilization regulator
MRRARQLESAAGSGEVRGAAAAAPRPTPLTMVSGAVAGDDLDSVAGSASEALGRPVAIALPTLGAFLVWPPDASTQERLRDLTEHAEAVVRGGADGQPPWIADSVPVRIGQDVVGVVAALGEEALGPDERSWLEAAAAAAAVTSLIRESQEGDLEGARQALIRAIATGPATDGATLLMQARRLGFDLGSGAVAVCVQRPDDFVGQLPSYASVLLTDVGRGRMLGLAPCSAESEEVLAEFSAELESRGMTLAISGMRRDAAALHEALREAEVLVELASSADAALATHEETYRLLIGVLLRDTKELELLRERTISAISAYDSEHDTDLLATLQAFLAHHGSTTETAEAMNLHRHTVGYRLSRVQEVSGLSPYESDGRERLSLGLKADQILEADERRARRE